MRTLVALLLCSILPSCRCTPAPQRRPQKEPAQLRLPLLQANPLEPIQLKECFTSDGYGSIRYRCPGGLVPSGSTFPSDAEAVEACVQFLASCFGPLPDPLEATCVGHSSMGDPSPRSPEDVGYTVTLHARHEGIRVEESFAVVYISGTTVTMATVGLLRLTAIPGSELVVLSEEEARRIWVEGVPATLETARGGPAEMRLEYLFTPWDNAEATGRPTTLAPQWAGYFTPGGDCLYVDAIRGQLWRND